MAPEFWEPVESQHLHVRVVTMKMDFVREHKWDWEDQVSAGGVGNHEATCQPAGTTFSSMDSEVAHALPTNEL